MQLSVAKGLYCNQVFKMHYAALYVMCLGTNVQLKYLQQGIETFYKGKQQVLKKMRKR